MRSNFFVREITSIQQSLYQALPHIGRLGAIPVAILDAGFDTLKVPLQAIQNLALFFINLVGCLFSKEYTLKDALKNLESSANLALITSVAIVMAAPKAVYQFLAIMIDPIRVRSYCEQETFASKAPPKHYFQ